MEEVKSTYSKGLKGIAVFGGLQAYKILISIVTTKVSAIFLGPIGVGIYGLISSSLITIESLSSCGLGTSAIKDFANARKRDDIKSISKIYKVLLSTCLLLGLVGCIFCIIGSEWLSTIAFGNVNYSWAFITVSVTLIFSQLISAQGAILVGLGKLKHISKMRIGVSTLTLLLVVPLYWIYGKDGIVPVIVGTSLIYFILSSYYTNKIKLPKEPISSKEFTSISKQLFITGIALSLGFTLTSISGYTIRTFISHYGDEVSVGLFISSFSLVNTYLGLIFSSIESDFYPRLSSTTENKMQFRQTLSEEMELVTLLVIPLILLLIVYSQPLLGIFYSSKFYPAKDLIIWSALSMGFRIPGWCCSIGLISTNRNKIYISNQILYTLYQLLLNMFFYYKWGLLGVGISYFIGQTIYSIQTALIMKKHGIKCFTKKCFVLISTLFLCALAAAIICTMAAPLWSYTIGTALTIATRVYSLFQLNNRLQIKQILQRKLKR